MLYSDSPGGLLWEFLGMNVPLGPWSPLAYATTSSAEFCYPLLD